jgi:hypothetical protein
MPEYGLPSQRDAEGNLQAVEHTFEFDDQEVTIKLVPPTFTQLEEYEDMGENVSTDELRTIIDKHLAKPDLKPGEMTVREVECYVQGIVDYDAAGSDLAQAAQEELAERESAPGN